MAFVLTVSLIFGVTLLSQPGLSAGWWWDLWQGLGYAALAAWCYLIVDTGKGSSKAHLHLSIATYVCLCAHTLGLFISDPTVQQYLAWDGPLYMASGTLSLLLISVAFILALPRHRRYWHRGYAEFQRWHRWLAWLALACTLFHVYGSGNYLGSWGFAVITCLLIGLIVFHMRRPHYSPTYSSVHLLALPASLLVFVIARQL